MIIRIDIDRKTIKKMKNSLGVTENILVINEALTILNWAIEEREKDRFILSSDNNGGDIEKLVLPRLEYANVKKNIS